MNSGQTQINDVDAYIAGCRPDIQPLLRKLRSTIQKAAPRATERISYGMPFYAYGGKGGKARLIYFAAFKNHISLFITPGQNETIPRELEAYHVSKATYQFPLGQPFPLSLIEKTVRSLVAARDLQAEEPTAGNEVLAYHARQTAADKAICDVLYREIRRVLTHATNKVWHGHPVWFLDDNPIVGYSKQKAGIRLMFWSGADFDEPTLAVRGVRFKDASVFYRSLSDINTKDLKRWLKKSIDIQWDYKNLIKRKGKLERLT